ncbi:MAG: cytochrome C oxidase subunit II [Gemmatimonadota bacterium]|nr:cytochrome C oxidase subunit II [Gemmatimonadota bacterium]MDE2866639.1 cytochrome C oxidase subunit II [Gemmatimonadota bacterium]MXV96857.1 cytochrome C oxidase subunit II [Gemmatimonadota bacterium]MYE17088.1 cytochrome C oxidase subunit II [Gemmatimonadota bacterium]
MNSFFEFFEFSWFDSLVEVGSSYAEQIDGLILTVLIIVGIWFLAAEYIFLHFILKFRAKPGRRGEYIDGKNKRHKRWITIPHLCVLAFDVLIILVSFRVWYNIKMDLPEDPDAVIRVIGQQWAWTFQHPGADGELDTPDDIFTVDELHVENEKTYHFELQSTDVLHSFSVPVWRIKQDAIPGRTITGWFEPTRTGRYDVQCAEICGFGHGVMAAHVMVEDAETHAAWVAANTPAAQ